MSFLLDTNVISELASRRPSRRVLAWVDGLDREEAFLSVITIGELRKGAEKLAPSRRREQLLLWVTADLPLRFGAQIVPLTTEVLLAWGELVGRLEREGCPMPAIDSLLAATALARGLTLATRNVEDFRHAGVALHNPWDQG